jgi:hypothetical protein
VVARKPPTGSAVLGIISITQIYQLAALPIGYLARQDALRGRMRAYERLFNPYREVFIAGAQAYQQHTYLELVRRIYSRAVAYQVDEYQRRLFDFMTGSGRPFEQALDLVGKALATRAVSATTQLGEIAIPIEMNVALALLLGLPESPDYVTTAPRRAEQIARMQPEIDWRLANDLTRARKEMVKTFSPVLVRLDGVAGKKTRSASPDQWRISGDR